MLENPTDSSSTATKRYAPPNHRNRSRKSGVGGVVEDQIEGINSSKNFRNDGDKHRGADDNHGDIGSNLADEIPLHGCCNSEAFQLLNHRWAAAINAFNDQSIELAERPVMYSGSGTVCGHFRLPHQMDFLSELHRAIHNANLD